MTITEFAASDGRFDQPPLRALWLAGRGEWEAERARREKQMKARITDAAAAFIPAKPKKKADKTTKAPTPIKATTKKATAKKQIAA